MLGVGNQRAVAEVEEIAIPSIREILERHFAHNGGRLVHGNLHSLRARGQLHQDDAVTSFQLFRKRPELWRIHLVDGSQQYWVGGFDGQRAWLSMDEADGRMSQKFANGSAPLLLKDELRLSGPLIRASRTAGELVVEGVDASSGPRPVFVVQAKYRDGQTIRIGVDSKHYQEVFIEEQTENGLKRREYDNFIAVEQHHVAMEIRHFFDGELVGQVVVEDVLLNPGLFDSFFTVQFSE